MTPSTWEEAAAQAADQFQFRAYPIVTDWNGELSDHSYLLALKTVLRGMDREFFGKDDCTGIEGFYVYLGSITLDWVQWRCGSAKDDHLQGVVLPLIASKQRDYGHENILRTHKHTGIMVRLMDKLARLENLLKTGKPALNESFVDSLNDVIGYATIGSMVSKDTFTLPLAEDAAVA